MTEDLKPVSGEASEVLVHSGLTPSIPAVDDVESGDQLVRTEVEAIMRPFWVSWYGKAGTFELHSPWWISGSRFSDDADTICAAVMANDEFGACCVVQWAHDEPTPIEWRFVEERPAGWSPFSDRFRRADWMKWPDATSAQAAGTQAEGRSEPK